MLETQNSVNYFSPGRKIGLNVPHLIDNGIKNKTPKGPCGKLKIFVYARVFGPQNIENFGKPLATYKHQSPSRLQAEDEEDLDWGNISPTIICTKINQLERTQKTDEIEELSQRQNVHYASSSHRLINLSLLNDNYEESLGSIKNNKFCYSSMRSVKSVSSMKSILKNPSGTQRKISENCLKVRFQTPKKQSKSPALKKNTNPKTPRSYKEVVSKFSDSFSQDCISPKKQKTSLRNMKIK